MSVRGRGCLEIRSSNNPFFQSTSNDIGRTIENTPSDWAIKGEPPKFSTKKREVDGNFLFLYSRESDRIGERLPKPASAEVRMLSRTEFLKQRRERALTQSGGQEIDLNAELEQATTTQKLTAQELLQVYKHEPKYEDPRYITSQSEYGKKPPTLATIVTDRASTQQAFSNSFLNVKPKNTSLTTSLTKSNVHKTLDPQFA